MTATRDTGSRNGGNGGSSKRLPTKGFLLGARGGSLPVGRCIDRAKRVVESNQAINPLKRSYSHPLHSGGPSSDSNWPKKPQSRRFEPAV